MPLLPLMPLMPLTSAIGSLRRAALMLVPLLSCALMPRLGSMASPSPALEPSQAPAAAIRIPTGSTSSATDPWRAAFEATGSLSVFPYSDGRRALRCTATHLGGGLVLTAGHCFLGARDCLGGRVAFNGEAREARCVRVVSVSSAVLGRAGVRVDAALFLVDRPPAAALDISNASLPIGPDVRLLSPEGVNGSRSDSRGRTALTCQGIEVASVDAYGRSRPVPAFVTRCPHSGFAHGAPLVDATGLIVGLVQGAHRKPTSISPVTVVAAAARLSDAIEAARKNLATLPTTASLTEVPDVLDDVSETFEAGSFSTDAFPYGLHGNLDFTLVTLGGEGVVTLAVQTGPLTRVEIVDASGRMVSFEGVPRLTDAAARVFSRPVRVRVRTDAAASSVSARVDVVGGDGTAQP